MIEPTPRPRPDNKPETRTQISMDSQLILEGESLSLGQSYPLKIRILTEGKKFKGCEEYPVLTVQVTLTNGEIDRNQQFIKISDLVLGKHHPVDFEVTPSQAGKMEIFISMSTVNERICSLKYSLTVNE